MEVLIDGVKYVPANENKITVRNIEYDNISHWLLNIEAILLHHLVESAELAEKNGGNSYENESVRFWRNQVKDFEDLCKNYLGFKRNGMTFVEIDDVDYLEKI